jgi:hypothetical protein
MSDRLKLAVKFVLSAAFAALFAAIGAYVPGIAGKYCQVLAISPAYCNGLAVQWHVALFIGAVIAALFGEFHKTVGLTAVAFLGGPFLIVAGADLHPFRNDLAWLAASLQFGIGLILGLIVNFGWRQFGNSIVAFVANKLGVKP